MLLDLTICDSKDKRMDLLWYSPWSFMDTQLLSSWAVIYPFLILGEILFLTAEVGLELDVGMETEEVGTTTYGYLVSRVLSLGMSPCYW